MTSCLPGGHRCGLEREVVIRRCRCAENGSFPGLRAWWTVIGKDSDGDFRYEGHLEFLPGSLAGRSCLKKRRVISKVGKEPLQWFSCPSSIQHPISPEVSSWVRGSEGLAPDGAISCSGPHSKLEASYITAYVAGAIHPILGYIASKIQRLSKNYASF